MDKIELIFNMYKDSVVIAKRFKMEMIKKYRLSDKEIRNLFVRIQNYQVNKFGERLTYQERAYTQEEKENVNHKASQRRYDKREKKRKNKLLDNYFGDVMGQIDLLINQAKELNK